MESAEKRGISNGWSSTTVLQLLRAAHDYVPDALGRTSIKRRVVLSLKNPGVVFAFERVGAIARSNAIAHVQRLATRSAVTR